MFAAETGFCDVGARAGGLAVRGVDVKEAGCGVLALWAMRQRGRMGKESVGAFVGVEMGSRKGVGC